MTRQDYATKLQVANIQLQNMERELETVGWAIDNEDCRHAYERAEHLADKAEKLCATLRELIKLEETLEEEEDN